MSHCPLEATVLPIPIYASARVSLDSDHPPDPSSQIQHHFSFTVWPKPPQSMMHFLIAQPEKIFSTNTRCLIYPPPFNISSLSSMFICAWNLSSRLSTGSIVPGPMPLCSGKVPRKQQQLSVYTHRVLLRMQSTPRGRSQLSFCWAPR